MKKRQAVNRQAGAREMMRPLPPRKNTEPQADMEPLPLFLNGGQGGIGRRKGTALPIDFTKLKPEITPAKKVRAEAFMPRDTGLWPEAGRQRTRGLPLYDMRRAAFESAAALPGENGSEKNKKSTPDEEMRRIYFPQTGIPEYDWDTEEWSDPEGESIEAFRGRGMKLFNTNYIMAPGTYLSEENQRRIAQVEEATALLDRTVKERHMTELLKIIQPPYTFYTDYNRVGPPYRRAIEERLHHNDLPKGALKLLGAGADAGMALLKVNNTDSIGVGKIIDFTGEILTPGPSFSDGADWLINQMEEPDMSVKEASLAAQNAFLRYTPHISI